MFHVLISYETLYIGVYVSVVCKIFDISSWNAPGFDLGFKMWIFLRSYIY